MKRSIRAIMAFCLPALLLTPGAITARPTPAADDQAILVKQMAAEIKRLRLEVIEQAIEFQNWKLKRLEGELLVTQREQQRLRELESSIQLQLAGLAPHVSHEPSSGAEHVGKMEIVKAAHTEDGLKPIQLKQQSIAELEAELREDIGREKARLQELRQKAGKMRAAD
ncbi:MAG: hypothetical protein MOB07_25830 [Acidobacteria bacterium]|nr:hypothetical protein [Acidobacteriota bacterium]